MYRNRNRNANTNICIKKSDSTNSKNTRTKKKYSLSFLLDYSPFVIPIIPHRLHREFINKKTNKS